MMVDTFSENSLQSALGARPFRFYDVVQSTQDLAREWAVAEPELASGAVVIADHQEGGRGRQGRAWLSEPGSSVMCSVVLRPQLAPDLLPHLTIAGGLAVAETLARWLPQGVAIKWPNDVLVHGRKISGVLAEATWLGDDLAAMVLGIGINIRNDFANTPLAGQATSLEIELGQPVARHDVLAHLLASVDHWAAQVGTASLLAAWRNWLGTLGKRVTVYVQATPESFSGIAESVDERGALCVRLDSGELRCVLAADVGLRETVD